MRSGIAAIAIALILGLCAPAHAEPWQPTGDAKQIALWPDSLAIAKPEVKGPEETYVGDGLIGGKTVTGIRYVTRPTMTVYRPKGKNTGAAVLVFPGGGYRILAIDLEGTEVCDWLTAKGVTCIVLKYRVPGSGPYWNQDCNCRKIPEVPMALQDAQRAMGLIRQHAAEYGIDPHKLGVLGFSAGGHLVASVSTNLDRAYKPVDAADSFSSRPDFVIALYPGHLWEDDKPDLTMAPDIHVDYRTPPTFIVQAEDDPIDDVRHSLTYFLELKKANVPAELHIYPDGGHAFALRRTDMPITHWPELAEKWLATINMIPGK